MIDLQNSSISFIIYFMTSLLHMKRQKEYRFYGKLHENEGPSLLRVTYFRGSSKNNAKKFLCNIKWGFIKPNNKHIAGLFILKTSDGG